MRHIKLLFVVLLLTTTQVTAQKNSTPKKKYNSLMWEISGNGLKKRSFLFGSMHVSSKLAFNLSDTFYNALKQVDAVALESDPQIWQEVYNNSLFTRLGDLYQASANKESDEYISKNSFQYTETDKGLKAALASDPSVINQFLYRSYGSGGDFEENTYLDMHVYQCGKKLSKKFYGLEEFFESERLMLKAIRAQATESKRKSKSTEAEEETSNQTLSLQERIQDAYRAGNLDLLDSLSKKTMQSENFLEFFLYARNKVQADEIDNIINKGTTLFATVGAMHLPGKRGVIEMLRSKGYTLKPIIMGLQISKQRDEINKLKMPVTFSTQYSADSLYSVNMPGKLYDFSYASGGQKKQWLYADFGNGAYYQVTRLSTQGLFWGKGANTIYKKIDSLLYENIPGKILEKSEIVNNGYKGYNIVNKTRKGDVQRYNIFITPLELVVFKMSGFEEYVSGKEATDFFSSIKMNKQSEGWQTFTPKEGGFSIKLPGAVVINSGNASESDNIYLAMFSGGSRGKGYEAYDAKNDIYYNILNKGNSNYNFLEEDTFNLALANESFLTTTLFKQPTKRTQSSVNNIPYLETIGSCNDDYNYTNRIYLIGDNYYTITAKYKKSSETIAMVLNSFQYAPITQGTKHAYTDSLLYFSVNSSLAPDSLSQEFISISRAARKTEQADEKTSKTEEPYWHDGQKLVFNNDTTGEQIVVESVSYPKYYSYKDSADYWQNIFNSLNVKIASTHSNSYGDYPYGGGVGAVAKYGTGYGDNYDFYLKEKRVEQKNGTTICNIVYADTNTTLTITAKFILNKARLFTLYTLSNNGELSPAKKDFFESFTPLFDSSTNFSIATPKGSLFFADYNSKDSVTSKFAKKYINEVRFVETDLPNFMNCIGQLQPRDKKYLSNKEELIHEIGNLKSADTSISAYLMKLYNNAADTATFQNAVIKSLANLQTQHSFKHLANILINDPPVFEDNDDVIDLFDNIADTLQLAKSFIGELLPLTSLEDYKWSIYRMLASGIDSNLITAKDYETIFSKIYFDAKIELKKLKTSDEKLMNKTLNEEGEDTDEEKTKSYFSSYDLKTFCKLLLPFLQSNPNIKPYVEKILTSRNNEVRLDIAKLISKKGIAVADSIWNAIATDEATRLEAYAYLNEEKKLHLFPAKFSKQHLMCKQLLQSGYNKKDSVVYLNEYLPARFKNLSGNVHFFKYKASEKDVDWKIAFCGFQPSDVNKVSDDETILEFTDKVLKTNKPVKEQITKILNEHLYSLRKSSSKFHASTYGYGGGYFD